jgi:Flp pilus assembly protein protease CpaA
MHVSWNDKRVWYAVAAAVIVLLIIAYAAGWFGGAGATLPAPTPY